MANTKWLAVLSILTICQACSLSDHPVVHSNLGRLTSFAEVEKVVDTPGPIDVETINSADWTVQLAGLVNLKSASAKE
jgi:N-acyl homoserine lactone hydrolase